MPEPVTCPLFAPLPRGTAARLARPAYHQDFSRVFRSGIGFLNKLERGQEFKERGFPSWEAFAAGRWAEALRLVEEKRNVYREQFAEADRIGVLQRRVRVMEFPVTPYVQWELHVLRLRVELGDHIRLIDARTITETERERQVPEVVVLGDAAMYEVIYDADGNADGARRYDDPALIATTNAGFDALYERGEAFEAFFEREIAGLPAPAPRS
ncbi:DUF6879 family protein [Streptantibioticus parmotrematis]|uniref:DUF6879 family protein n=1 Tax=Streptantibioticus parmotrematis TaxID=2873249 RepID=UPI0033D4EDC9